ncbi:MAG: hypothetical protein LBH29_01905 [Elusimicrobiota bacterium]|jgi:hypothetical protein|nr:hypothetical protein [Elusimicrobiota bacterium]
MKKKMAIVLSLLFLMSVSSFAIGNFEADTFSINYDKSRLSEMRKDYNGFKKEVRKLIAAYNKAQGSEKVAIRGDIEKLVSARTDKDLILKREMSANVLNQIREIETNKKNYVGKRIEMLLSAEGQKKLSASKKEKKVKEKKA